MNSLKSYASSCFINWKTKKSTFLYKKERLRYDTNKHEIKNETKYSRVDQVKFVESRL